MSRADAEVVVLGAGIAGLAAARELAAAGRTPWVVDPGDRPGGVMQTDAIDGYRVETGPNTFQAKAPFCAFASRHGLWRELECADPESRSRWIFHQGRLVELPHGPGSAIRTPLLSARGKLRVLAEPFVRGGDPTGDSVHAFVSRRLGAEASTSLVGAFLTGVYAGDERELGAEAVFPGLVAWERSHGSLLRGALADVLARRRARAGGPEERARRGTWSARGGLGRLADALAAGLPAPVQLGTRAREIARDGSLWRVTLSGREGERSVRAPQLVVATPAWAAAPLLQGVAPEAARCLAGIAYAPIAAVALAADPAEVRRRIEGFGFIVPRAAGAKLLGCLFMSRLFPGRAPEGRELLHNMLGGVRWPEAVELPDDRLLEVLLGDLDRCLGLRAEPRTLCVRRWQRAIPQPGRDHRRRVEAILRELSRLPGLALAGSFLSGVSVADTLDSGVVAARHLLRSADAGEEAAGAASGEEVGGPE